MVYCAQTQPVVELVVEDEVLNVNAVVPVHGAVLVFVALAAEVTLHGKWDDFVANARRSAV